MRFCLAASVLLGLLFLRASNVPALKSVGKAQEKTAVNPATPVNPVHIQAMISPEDWSLMESVDPSIIAKAYLMIGNYIEERFIKGFLRSMAAKRHDLHELFNKSADEFEQELQVLWLEKRETVEEALNNAIIPDYAFFLDCLKWYRKRLRVAHPTVISYMALSNKLALYHLSSLLRSERDTRSELTGAHLDLYGFSKSGGPVRFASQLDKQSSYDLAVLGIQELNKQTNKRPREEVRLKLQLERNRVAHDVIPFHIYPNSLTKLEINSIRRMEATLAKYVEVFQGRHEFLCQLFQ